MTCDREKVIALAQGELAFDEAAETRAHLRGCSACERYLESIHRLEGCIRESMSVEEDMPSIADSVMARIPSRGAAQRVPVRWRTLVPRFALAVAAAWLLVAAWLRPVDAPDQVVAPRETASSHAAPRPIPPAPKPALHLDQPRVAKAPVRTRERRDETWPAARSQWEMRSASEPWEVRSASSVAEAVVESREVVTVVDADGNVEVVVTGPPSSNPTPIPDRRELTASVDTKPRPVDESPMPRYPDRTGRHARPEEVTL